MDDDDDEWNEQENHPSLSAFHLVWDRLKKTKHRWASILGDYAKMKPWNIGWGSMVEK